MKSFAFAAAGAAILAATPAFAKGPAPKCAPVTEAAVAAQFDKFNAAWATKNPDTVTALFGKDAVLLATVSNKPRTDAAGIRDYFVSFLKNAPVGTINTSTFDLGCNMATRVGTWTVKLTNPGNRRLDRCEGALHLHLQVRGRKVEDRPSPLVDDARKDQLNHNQAARWMSGPVRRAALRSRGPGVSHAPSGRISS